MDDLTFEQMMEVMQTGHSQTMEMLDKLIELKRLERSKHEDTDTTVGDVVRIAESGK